MLGEQTTESQAQSNDVADLIGDTARTRLVVSGEEKQDKVVFKPKTLAGVRIWTDKPQFVQGKVEKSVMNFIEDERKPIE